MNNCFRCGIPLENELMECPDCKLKYFDLGSLSSDSEPFVIKFKDEKGRTYEGMVKLTGAKLNVVTDKVTHIEGIHYSTICQDITAQLDFHFIPFDNGNHITHFIMTCDE